jgi:hypothetical protein
MTSTDDYKQRAGATADRIARRAVLDLIAQTGGLGVAVDSPVPPGEQPPMADVFPAAGLRAARMIEQLARVIGHEYMRGARTTGISWQEIGAAAWFLGSRDDESDPAFAVAAFDYATGSAPENGEADDRMFPWDCPVCLQVIMDRGPACDPHDAQQGHIDDCPWRPGRDPQAEAVSN